MALGFFRRRQKLVIIIMVVLMVSFLVGGYGFSTLLQRDPSEQVVADTRYGELTRGEINVAGLEMDILSGRLGLGRYNAPTGAAFTEILRAGDNAAGAFALLLKEANHRGVKVGGADVDQFLASMGLTEQEYDRFISAIKASGQGITEAHFRGAVADWLRIHRSFLQSSIDTPPSEAEVRLVYRNVQERVALKVLRIPAERFLDKVDDPNDAAIQEQFDAFRVRLPGRPQAVSDMGFGYRRPARAQVVYLLLRGAAVRRVVQPPFDQVVDYYNANREQFVRTTTQPGPDAEPTGKPMSFAEARPQIVEQLGEQAVQQKLDELLTLVETQLDRVGGDPNEAYHIVRRAMQTDASELLAKPLTNVNINALPLDQAIERLAEKAGLKGICYPWGTHGDQTLLPSVKVVLQADRITLGEALAGISEQLKWPGTLHWAGCQGLPDVLFSVEQDGNGVDFFPLSAVTTDMLSQGEMMRHPVLGAAFANPAGGDRNALPRIAFTAEKINPDPQRQTPLVRVGAETMTMYVLGRQVGRLLWRLVDVSPGHVPEQMDAELRKEVVEDLKLKRAMELAAEEAAKIAKIVSTEKAVDLDAIADARGYSLVSTGLFARLGQGLQPAPIPNLNLPPGARGVVMERAFALAPENVNEPASQQPAKPAVLPLPVLREAFVMQRTGYEPPLRPVYEDMGRLQVAQFLHYRNRQVAQRLFFDFENITARLGVQTQ